MIEIITVGKKHEPWVEAGIMSYSKRLQRPWDIKWEHLPHSSLEGTRARLEESQRILKRLDGKPFVALLDETGQLIDSPALARTFSDRLDYGTTITLIIGGAYGVDKTIHDRADLVWSLSSLVFPHQMVRLMVTEQIYRSQQITQGHDYHHGS